MSKKLVHVAYVCADRGVPVGGHKGASAHVTELTRALGANGAEVRIVAARLREDVAESALPAPVIDVGGQRSMRQVRQVLFADARTEKTKTAAGEAFGLFLNQSVGKALERLHKEWGIDAVYERYSLWGHAAATFARSNGIPYLLEVNAPLRDEQRRYRSLENAPVAASIESYVFAAADRVLVPSSALIPYVTAHGARSAAVHVTPNAADPDRFYPEGGKVTAHDPEKSEFVVGFSGSLKPWHGIDHLLRAFRRLHRSRPQYRLLIVGDGPMRAELERDVRRNGLRMAVTFTGAVEIDDVAANLRRMDVAVAPYPRLPGFYFSPLKLFEYMAAGVPIVASDIGQISEVLEHRRTALLHRPGAVIELAASIEELRRKPELARKLGQQARLLARRRFTWRRNAERIIAMIRTDVKRKGARETA